MNKQNYFILIAHTSLLTVPTFLYLKSFRPVFYRDAGMYSLVTPLALWLFRFFLIRPINEYETSAVTKKSQSMRSKFLFRAGNKIGGWQSLNLAAVSKIRSTFAISNSTETEFAIIGTLIASMILIII